MEQSSNKKAGRSRKYTIIILLILFIIGTVQTLSGRTGSVIAQVDDNMLGVVGSYGDPVFVRLDEITRLELVDAVSFGRCLEGEEKAIPCRACMKTASSAHTPSTSTRQALPTS